MRGKDLDGWNYGRMEGPEERSLDVAHTGRAGKADGRKGSKSKALT